MATGTTALTETVRAVLSEPRFAVVATTDADGTPQMSVVWYELDGDTLTFSTTRNNRKHRNLQRAPQFAVCIEDGYRYVTLHGTASFEADPAIVSADITRQSVRYLGPEQGTAMAANINREPHVLISMAITQATVYGFEQQHA